MVRFRFDTIGINDAIFMVPGARVAASNLGILSPGWDFGWVSHDLGDFAGGTKGLGHDFLLVMQVGLKGLGFGWVFEKI